MSAGKQAGGATETAKAGVSAVLAPVEAPGGARLPQFDFAQPRQGRLQARPDPARDDLAGRVFQALDVVEVAVVELGMDWLASRLD